MMPAFRKPDDVLKLWMTAVNHGNMDDLCGLYHANAILLPTFSNRILNTPERIREYFERLGSRADLSIALHDKTLGFQLIDRGVHAISGIYCWRFVQDDELFSFEARFTYVVNLAERNPIIHHHSSQIPRTL